MSKTATKTTVQVTPTLYAYSIARKDSGYYITKHTLQDNQVVSSIKMSEPDMLMICMSTLEKLVRKENGL